MPQGPCFFIRLQNTRLLVSFWLHYTFLTFGLAFLETTANPYILSMGSEETATRRLNLAQAFNPVGSLLGMFVAQQFILSRLQSDVLNSQGELIYTTLGEVEKAKIRSLDLMVIRDPYLLLGIFVIFMILIISLTKMPKTKGRFERQFRRF